jgi:phospholipid/cholesterol/gamma-HCH transport system substrate-binding protein
MAEITEKINSGKGSLGQLLNSDSLVVELQQSNQELQYLLNDLYTNPKKYVGFSIVGRKDRNGFSDKEEDAIKKIIQEESGK